VWVRDLPVVGSSDLDQRQGTDPWWCLGWLSGSLDDSTVVGTTSIILGIRHPLVVARAAVGAQLSTGARFVLGVGSRGKGRDERCLGYRRPVVL